VSFLLAPFSAESVTISSEKLSTLTFLKTTLSKQVGNLLQCMQGNKQCTSQEKNILMAGVTIIGIITTATSMALYRMYGRKGPSVSQEQQALLTQELAAILAHETLSDGQFETMKSLIRAGANVNTIGEDNMTPLHWASLKGDLEFVKFLIEQRKANPYALTITDQETPFDLAKTAAITSYFVRSVKYKCN
jgi:hypothetical protein